MQNQDIIFDGEKLFLSGRTQDDANEGIENVENEEERDDLNVGEPQVEQGEVN